MKIKKLLINAITVLTTLLSSFTHQAKAQQYEWATATTSGSYCDLQYLVTDSIGNSYAGGNFCCLAQITIGTQILVGNNTATGYTDALIIKHDTLGNVLWAKRAGNNMRDDLIGIGVDGAGNVYAAFYSHDYVLGNSITFQMDGASITSISTYGSAYFLAKLSPVGNVLWLKNFHGQSLTGVSDEYPLVGIGAGAFHVDKAGNIYIGGGTSDIVVVGNDTLFNDIDDPFQVKAHGDIALVKLDSSGTPLWARQSHGGFSSAYGNSYGSDNVAGEAVTTDKDGNVFITGYFQGEVRFYYDAGYNNNNLSYYDTDSANFVTIVTDGGSFQDIFLAKYSANGQFQWVQQTGGYNWGDDAYAVGADENGNAYIIFRSSGFVRFFADTAAIASGSSTFYNGPNTGNTYIAKYSGTAGDLKWVVQNIAVGGSTSDVRANNLQIDKNNNIYTAIGITSNMTFESTVVASSGSKNIAVAAYDTLGNLQSVHRVGGSYAIPFKLSLDNNNNLYMLAQGSAPVYYNAPVDGSNSSYDVQITAPQIPNCLSKFNPNPIIYRDTVTVIQCESYTWQGNTYTTSGFYIDTVWAGAAIDSIHNLNLTINYGTHNSETQTANGSYTWHGTTYSLSDVYTYNYNNSDSCASTDTLHLTINITTGIKGGNNENLNLSVYPNPVNNSVIIQSSERVENVSIYNTVGMLVQQEDTNEFSVQQLAAGIYTFKITTVKGVSIIKVVKE